MFPCPMESWLGGGLNLVLWDKHAPVPMPKASKKEQHAGVFRIWHDADADLEITPLRWEPRGSLGTQRATLALTPPNKKQVDK